MILKPMLLSLKIASIATIFSLIIGVYLAKVMTKKDFPGKNAAEVLITLPMVLPPSVTGYILLICLAAGA